METGRVLEGRWTIGAPIAEGATSSVFEATDGESGEVVAVKAVSIERAGWRAEVRDRFQQEARLLELARDEHLVGIRAMGETDDGFLYLVLERLRGETLADRIARRPPLDWRAAAVLARDLARGLGALHAAGVVHRDVKPANVILHDPGGGAAPVAKLIDLGISKVRAAAADPVLFATLTSTGQVLGTPEYMSYEQALGQRDVDARSDVWSLGAVLYEMLAGRRPFEANNVNAVLAVIRKAEPAPLARVPAPLAAVVARTLRRDRAQRPADGAALADEIDEALAQARPAPSRVMLVGAVLVALGLAVVVALLLAAPPPGEGPRGGESAAPVATASAAPSATISAPALVIPATAPASAATAPGVPPPPSVPPSRPAQPSGRPVTRVNDAGF